VTNVVWEGRFVGKDVLWGGCFVFRTFFGRTFSGRMFSGRTFCKKDVL
jgi:hypothetical protein